MNFSRDVRFPPAAGHTTAPALCRAPRPRCRFPSAGTVMKVFANVLYSKVFANVLYSLVCIASSRFMLEEVLVCQRNRQKNGRPTLADRQKHSGIAAEL